MSKVKKETIEAKAYRVCLRWAFGYLMAIFVICDSRVATL